MALNNTSTLRSKCICTRACAHMQRCRNFFTMTFQPPKGLGNPQGPGSPTTKSCIVGPLAFKSRKTGASAGPSSPKGPVGPRWPLAQTNNIDQTNQQNRKHKSTSHTHSLPSQKHTHVHMHDMNILKTNLPILYPVLTLSLLPRGTDHDKIKSLFSPFFHFSLKVQGPQLLSTKDTFPVGCYIWVYCTEHKTLRDKLPISHLLLMERQVSSITHIRMQVVWARRGNLTSGRWYVRLRPNTSGGEKGFPHVSLEHWSVTFWRRVRDRHLKGLGPNRI